MANIRYNETNSGVPLAALITSDILSVQRVSVDEDHHISFEDLMGNIVVPVVIDNNLDLTATATNRILLPMNDDAANPTVGFGDGGFGMYAITNNVLGLSLGGLRYTFNANAFFSGSTNAFYLRRAAPNANTPSYSFNSDNDTGPGGRAHADGGTLVAGGVETLRYSEGSGKTSVIISSTVVKVVADATSAGDNTLTKAAENFDVTCSVGDAVLIYAGTTVADYDIYFITDTTATVLTLDRALAGSDADVDFDVLTNGVVIENSTNSGVATMRLPGALHQAIIIAALTDDTPTDAEIDAATGLTPATAGPGYMTLISDSDGSGLLYRIFSDGTDWYYEALTKAA